MTSLDDSHGPGFGPALRSEWLLDERWTYLNHGTVGAPPRRVHEAQAALRAEIERQPAIFMLRELADESGCRPGPPSRMRAAANEVAPFVGLVGDELAFVDNITAGTNAVLRSLSFGPGDQILVTSLGYGGITRAVQYVADRSGATVRTVEMPPIGAGPEAFVDAVRLALTPSVKLAVVDHIAATAALILPIAEIAAVCHAADVPILVDGAHVPGAIPLDIPSLGVDYYVANLHKWAWTPRSAGILWASESLRAAVRPLVISWGFGNGFTAEFDLPGTHEPTAFLTAPVAIRMLEEFGVADVHAYNHELAMWTGGYLSDRWGTRFDTPEEMIGTMVSVALPESLGTSADDARRVQDALLWDHSIEVPVASVAGRLRTRVSCQVYVGRADVERLGSAVLDLAGR